MQDFLLTVVDFRNRSHSANATADLAPRLNNANLPNHPVCSGLGSQPIQLSETDHPLLEGTAAYGWIGLGRRGPTQKLGLTSLGEAHGTRTPVT